MALMAVSGKTCRMGLKIASDQHGFALGMLLAMGIGDNTQIWIGRMRGYILDCTINNQHSRAVLRFRK